MTFFDLVAFFDYDLIGGNLQIFRRLRNGSHGAWTQKQMLPTRRFLGTLKSDLTEFAAIGPSYIDNNDLHRYCAQTTDEWTERLEVEIETAVTLGCFSVRYYSVLPTHSMFGISRLSFLKPMHAAPKDFFRLFHTSTLDWQIVVPFPDEITSTHMLRPQLSCTFTRHIACNS